MCACVVVEGKRKNISVELKRRSKSSSVFGTILVDKARMGACQNHSSFADHANKK